MYSIAILAGGLATRLRPLTETVPKSLIPVAGSPFIHHQLKYIRGQGIKRIVICTGYLGEQIEAFVGNGERYGLEIKYSSDGLQLLGTGGAIKNAIPLLGDVFFVLYGDSFLPCNYNNVQQAFERSGNSALMVLSHNRDRWDKSNVLFRESKIIEYNKKSPRNEMEHIDYGLGIFSAKVFDQYPPNIFFDLSDVYRKLAFEGLLGGLEVSERFFEVGSFSGIKEANNYLNALEPSLTYSEQHLQEAKEIISRINFDSIERLVDLLSEIKRIGGRIFFLGVGGSAGNCSHAVNDFRKIVGIESYAPTDNVSELTARTNDEGWATIFVEWLKISRLSSSDALFILSVGGGSLDKNISPNLVTALQHAKSVGAKITGIVGRDGGYTAQVADVYVHIPTVNPETVTPHAEAFQSVIWHLLVSHPKLKANQTKWESTKQ